MEKQMSAAEIAQLATDWAKSKLGYPYDQALRTSGKAYDCSSLVALAYSAHGKKWKYGGNVPLSWQEVYDDDFELLWPDAYEKIGRSLGSEDEIALASQAGDLLFFCTDKGTTRSNRITHVGMSLGDGRMVHARGKAYGVCVNDASRYAGKLCAVIRYNPSCQLRRGMKGNRTTALQEALTRHGAQLSVDGEYGRHTEAAVQACQQKYGLPATGIADQLTLDALSLAGTAGVVVNTSVVTDPAHRMVITGDTVNLRSGPGTSYDIVRVLKKDDCLPLVDTAGWNPVLDGDIIRWVSARYSREA